MAAPTGKKAAPDISAETPELRKLWQDFISGCHILHYHQVLDAYGHLSVRHPQRPDRFFMSRYIAPGTISSSSDLVEYYVDNAEPVDPNSPKGYSERCIHSEVLKRFKSVNAVNHSHSQAVVPYTINGVPMKPCFHMAGFLGTQSPIYDIGKYYEPGDQKNMLVSNTRLGSALASHFGAEGGEPGHAVVLMRGHGFTVQGESIMDVVLRAVYTQQNAGIQTTSLITRAAQFGVGANGEDNGIHYLSEEECEGATVMTKWSARRPWGLWLREVEAQPMYVNLERSRLV